jgi:hypothetical protein
MTRSFRNWICAVDETATTRPQARMKITPQPKSSLNAAGAESKHAMAHQVGLRCTRTVLRPASGQLGTDDSAANMILFTSGDRRA